MLRIHYFLSRTIYFCTNITILFAFIHNSTTLCHSHICSLLVTKSDHFALHAGDSSYSSLPTVPPAQDFILGLANQAVPRTGSWRSLATAINYLVIIAPIVYLAFQARPASPVGVQPDSDMGHDIRDIYKVLTQCKVFEKFPKSNTPPKLVLTEHSYLSKHGCWAL
ncbi:hypothetical protein DSO57_1022308 [Entomophthora muscae]|uniref:Uncharacterized protein n=1 Tax=Entomophthora muscae TaxID=34485 RepID=A0ACC2SFS1_9FUNG|nr:hypothetical protein DSO57_1022308 [Entomophthora muscae]